MFLLIVVALIVGEMSYRAVFGDTAVCLSGVGGRFYVAGRFCCCVPFDKGLTAKPRDESCNFHTYPAFCTSE